MTDEGGEVALRFFELLQDGTPDDYGTPDAFSLYSPDCDIRLPSATTGALEQPSRDDLHASHARSASRFRDRRVSCYELIAGGPNAFMRYVWQVTVRDDSTEFPPRAVYRTDVAHFIEVRDGQIVRSHEYNHMENGQVAPSHDSRTGTASDSGEATAGRWVESFNRASSVSGYLSVFADDLDWWHMTDWWRGSEARFPKGKAGDLADYREALELDAAALTEQRMDPYLVIADGPRAAMRYRWFSTAPSGDRIAWDRVAVISADKGKISRLHEYGGPLAEN